VFSNQWLARLRFVQVDKTQAQSLFFLKPVPTMRKSATSMTPFDGVGQGEGASSCWLLR